MKEGIIKTLFKNPVLYAKILNNFRYGCEFNEDAGIRKLVDELIQKYPITSFVETGTARGDTAYYMAKKYPELKIWTCEVWQKLFRVVQERMDYCMNVRIFQQPSLYFLKTHSKSFGNFPFFYLDAHTAESSEQKEELAFINKNFKKAIILIDDIVFKGPGRSKVVNRLEEIEPLLENPQHVQRTPAHAETEYLLSIKGIK